MPHLRRGENANANEVDGGKALSKILQKHSGETSEGVRNLVNVSCLAVAKE
jgi:hypothetical protein